MTIRVMLISPARSEALEKVLFDDGQPLSTAGLRQLGAVAGAVAQAGRTYVSPTRRCRQTADGLGLRAEPAAEADGCAMGRWRGLSLAEVSAAEPSRFAAWLSDPDSAPHGGEPLRVFCARVQRWLTGLTADSGRVVAVVEPDVVRAAAVCALGASVTGFWRLDVAPLTATELSGRQERWNLRLGTELTG